MHSPHIHIPFHKIFEYIDFIKKRALNLELYFSSAVLDTISGDDLTDFQKALDYNPSLSIHAPFMDLSPGAVDSEVRKVTLARFSSTLDLAEVLKPSIIVFHSGYEKWKYDFNVDLWLENSLRTWRPIHERAGNIGVQIAIENIFEDNPNNLRLLMENMNSDNFGICFDTGHLNLFSKVVLEEWMESLNPYILELHLHDNNKKADQHLAIGEGTFDFETFFTLLRNKDCLRTIEAHTPESVVTSLAYLKKI